MSVCMSFRVLTQLGGCTSSSRKYRKGSGGQLRSIYPIYSCWGLNRIRLQIADRSVDRCQGRMLGWVSIFALWDTCVRNTSIITVLGSFS